MINPQQLRKQAVQFLNVNESRVHAVGIFDVSMSVEKRTGLPAGLSVTNGKKYVAPAAAGLAAGIITKKVQQNLIKNKNKKHTANCGNGELADATAYSLGNRFVTGAVGLATAVGTKKLLEVNDSKTKKLTLVVVTERSIYLLGWKGTHNHGEITKELKKFNRNEVTVQSSPSGFVRHIVTIKSNDDAAKIECNLSATHNMKKMNRELIRLLEASSSSTLPVPVPRRPKNNSVNFRWASTGGGWQSMVANMSFANVFSKAGLITNKGSRFSAISTQSGATWFSTQFFYSPQFFNKVVNSSPSQLSKFVNQWMNSYEAMYVNDSSKAQKRNNKFQELFTDDDDIKFKMLLDYMTSFNEYHGNWANVVSTFLKAASTGYGDPTFVDREVGSDNRVSPMSNTDLYLQTTLAPNSRNKKSSIGTFLGPADDRSKIYSLPTAVQYSVTDHETLYYTSLRNGDLSMNKYTRKLNRNFKLKNFEEFGSYPCENQSTLVNRDERYKYAGKMAKPFAGKTPTVGQISSASSAAPGPASPLVPSTFAQAVSTARIELKGKPLKRVAFDSLVDELYNDKKLNELSVDSQWPQTDSESDARFIDGCWTDGPTLALNIGQYQTREHGDRNKTLKIIVTNDGSSNVSTSLYFKSKLNNGIAPGEFLWSKKEDGKVFSILPIQSPQIFDTKDNFDIRPIDGLTVTTALIKTKTITNPAYKTKKGQHVKILLINLNSKIPIGIFGKEQIHQQTQPLVNMTKDISSNKELLRRIEYFVNEY